MRPVVVDHEDPRLAGQVPVEEGRGLAQQFGLVGILKDLDVDREQLARARSPDGLDDIEHRRAAARVTERRRREGEQQRPGFAQRFVEAELVERRLGRWVGGQLVERIDIGQGAADGRAGRFAFGGRGGPLAHAEAEADLLPRCAVGAADLEGDAPLTGAREPDRHEIDAATHGGYLVGDAETADVAMRREHRGRRTRPDELDEAGELRGDWCLAVGFEVEHGGAHAGRRSFGIAALQGERDAGDADREIAGGEHGQPGGAGLGGREPRIGDG